MRRARCRGRTTRGGARSGRSAARAGARRWGRPWRGSGSRSRRRTRSRRRPGGRRRRRCWRRSALGTGAGRPARRRPTTRRPSACRRQAASGTGRCATPRTGWRRPRRPRRRPARPRRSAARGRRSWSGQSSTSRPSTGPRSLRRRKSSSRKRGSLASACTPPPPTVDGRLLTSPVTSRSPSARTAAVGARLEQRVGAEQVAAGERRSRRWRSGAAARSGAVRSTRWLRPFSRMITDQPAAVSTSATVAPPGPEPTMMASQSRHRGAASRREQRLREVDALPAGAALVAAVGGIAVGGLAGVGVEHAVVARRRACRRALGRRRRADRRCAAPRPGAPTARARATVVAGHPPAPPRCGAVRGRGR